MYVRPIYYCSEKCSLKMNKSKQNCSSVVNGWSFCSVAAFCSLRARNLQDYEIKPVKPVPIESNHDIQSNFAIGEKPSPSARTKMREVIRMPQFKYHDTTATWNFFIFRIAIDPPATRTGFMNSTPHIAYFNAVLASAF